MDEQHLRNAIAMIERKGDMRLGWLPRLYMELAARYCPVVAKPNLSKLVGEVVAQLITRGLADKPVSAPTVPPSLLKASKTARSRSGRRGAGSSSTRKETRRSGTRSSKK